MGRRTFNGAGASAADFNLLFRRGEGYGVVIGIGGNCAVTIADDGSGNIEASCRSGTVAIEHDRVSVASQTVTLADGDPINDRKDLVWVDREGTLRVEPGDPAPKQPETATRWETGVPMLPDVKHLDGVPLKGVYVPSDATIADLSVFNSVDLRIGAPTSTGRIPDLDSDPSDEELLAGGSRLWNNTGLATPELRYYDSEAQEVYQVNRTSLRSIGTTGGGNDPILVEDFETDISGNWQGRDDDLDRVQIVGSPVYQGSGALEYPNQSGSIRLWSHRGDGLGAYAAPGDTIRIAIDAERGEQADVGFAKSSSRDGPGDEYRAAVDHDGGRFAIYRADGHGSRWGANNSNTLAIDTSVSYGTGYHVVEVDYDGSGEGQHDARLFTTASGAKDTQISSLSATQDTTYRGRGMAVGCVHETRWDALDVLK